MSVKQKTLNCKDLYGYLTTLPASTLDRLYTFPSTCLAVFRELPELGKEYVMRMLFVDQPVPQAVVGAWVSQAHAKDHADVAKFLSDLRVWYQVAIPGGLPGWQISGTFKKGLRSNFLGGSPTWVMQRPSQPDPKLRDVAFLDAYASERWDCVLHFMVGSQQQEGISQDAVRLLQHAGLMKKEDGENSLTITKDGFQFLLMDTASQVWYFLLQYLDTAPNKGLDVVECLSLLFQLSFSVLGKDYATDGISEGLLLFLQHLREFGLVYQRTRKAGRFYPTRLAVNLTAGAGKPSAELQTADSTGYIVVETNYRVYAYTDSNLQIALLGLFCELLYRFPNLTVGVITRETIRQALRSGISADQIITFLKQHAHPEAQRMPPALPPTISDQIRLWELERDRFSFKEGVMYNQFLSQVDFELLRNYAQDIGVLVWETPMKRTMVVTREGHEDVKKFWKRHNKGGS
nr:EOG090X04KD [Lepidurus arcticus]